MAELAELWNVEPMQIPHWGPPTHAMEIFRYAEQGSIEFLWVIGTNPAVSLPELRRIRSILGKEGLFLVVSDAFLSETARLADVVLPVALWGEKTGTFTNTDRTVHLSERAVDPPADLRSDMEIFLDYAHRLDLRDKDGEPLVKWSKPEECFEAWKECTRGRPCDYTGISYDKLRGGTGIQWPCNDQAPDGTERLYESLTFPTFPEVCEDYGHDLTTGATLSEAEFKALGPQGRAILKAAEWTPPHEWAGDGYPFALVTGRNVFHFHTRTKTGRTPELQAAAPGSLGRSCARRTPSASGSRKATSSGSLLRAAGSRCLLVSAGRARASSSSPSTTATGTSRRRRAGRAAACRERADNDDLGPGLEAAAAEDGCGEGGKDRVKIGPLLAHLEELEAGLAADLRAAAERHAGEHDVYHQCHTFAVTADKRMQRLSRSKHVTRAQPTWKTAVGGRQRQPARGPSDTQPPRPGNRRHLGHGRASSQGRTRRRASGRLDRLPVRDGDPGQMVPDQNQDKRATGARRGMSETPTETDSRDRGAACAPGSR